MAPMPGLSMSTKRDIRRRNRTGMAAAAITMAHSTKAGIIACMSWAYSASSSTISGLSRVTFSMMGASSSMARLERGVIIKIMVAR